MRENIAAGNWKMNTSISEAKKLSSALNEGYQGEATMILIPPFTHLSALKPLLSQHNVKLGAQNCNQHASGAYTGEISVEMLKEIGVDYVTLGHSERRMYFNENEALLAQKVNAVLGHDLIPIYCCGETKEQREEGIHFELIKEQITGGLFHLSADEISKIVIAYEPVWAIGTGLTATAEQAQEIHAHIRDLIRNQYGAEVANVIPILYGGSVKPTNANELFSCQDIDGGLVGGASLDAESFLTIANAF